MIECMLAPIPTTLPVLCFYRVWSAYKALGSVDGAKMIHVKSVKDIPLEFHVQITAEMKRGHKFLGIEYPSRWILRFAMLRDGQLVVGDKVKVDVDRAATLS
jgi:hypothetical protein